MTENEPRFAILLFMLAVFLLAIGCGRKDAPPQGTGKQPPVKTVSARKAYIETGDLNALKRKGKLRILVQRFDKSYLPRSGSPLDHERTMAAGFASSMGLEPVLVYVDDFQDLIPALLAGKGDIVAANLTVTKARKGQIAFTLPLDHSREQIVARADEEKLHQLSDLKGRTIAVPEGTSFWESANDLQKRYPEIRVKALPGRLSSDEILDKVAAKKIDLTIEDSNVLNVACAYRSDIKPVLDVTPDRPLAWAVRPTNPKLLEALNRYLNMEELTHPREKIYVNDLPGIKKRKVLRMITRNNAAAYFLWRGELMGFEFEMCKAFAKKHGLRLEVVVAPSNEELLPMLLAGKGDIAADFLTPTEQRRSMGVAFSRPYHYAAEEVVARADDQKLNKPEDLAGRTVVVRRASSHWRSLEKMKASGIALKLQEAPETMETEEIIAKVAEGTYDLTVADGEILDVEMTWRDDIRMAFPLGEPEPHAWAVRAKDTELLKAINDFFDKEYRGTFYNMMKKYFKTPRKVREYKKERIALNHAGQISPYDDLVKKFASEYGFDWRLIVAQMYQESHFNPNASTCGGAKGLLQVMPRTAQELGFQDLTDPATGIHAGVKYLSWMRERLDPNLDIQPRMWFALASYNAGLGHVQDARSLACQIDCDPNRWFDNVERAMLLLSKPEYAKKARHGYVRGQEPVNYVRQIRNRYRAYVPLIE